MDAVISINYPQEATHTRGTDFSLFCNSGTINNKTGANMQPRNDKNLQLDRIVDNLTPARRENLLSMTGNHFDE